MYMHNANDMCTSTRNLYQKTGTIFRTVFSYQMKLEVYQELNQISVPETIDTDSHDTPVENRYRFSVTVSGACVIGIRLISGNVANMVRTASHTKIRK